MPPPAAEGHDPHGDAAPDQVPPAPAEHRAEYRYHGPRSPISRVAVGPELPGLELTGAGLSSATEELAEREKVERAAECCREILHHVNQAVRDMEDLLVSPCVALGPGHWDECVQRLARPLSRPPRGHFLGGRAQPLACPPRGHCRSAPALGLSP